jgi:hypothetical protein
MKTNFYAQKISSENATKYGRTGQATDTHSEFSFHIIGFANGPQCYVYMHFTYLVIYKA